MEIWLIRHAESSGQSPTAPLTALGETQAQMLAATLKHLKINGLFSSPYQRAVSTLAPYAAKIGSKIQTNQDFCERLLAPELRQDWLVHVKASFKDPHYKLKGGESLFETAQRMRRGIATVAATNLTRVAIASHGNAISSLLMQLNPDFGFTEWQSIQNPDIFCLTLEHNMPIRYVPVPLKK